MQYTTVDESLIEALPELQEAYAALRKYWGDEHPGQYNVFGDILNPFLIRLVDSDQEDALRRRAFAFLEDMATSGDDDVINILQVTVCERLGDDPAVLTKAREFMGPQTRKASEEIERALGRE